MLELEESPSSVPSASGFNCCQHQSLRCHACPKGSSLAVPLLTGGEQSGALLANDHSDNLIVLDESLMPADTA